MDHARALIFLHIPKTGGMTLRQILRRQYPEHAICETAPTAFDVLSESLEGIRLLAGHVTFGVHERLAVPADYITLLRHPVERLVSLYFYVLRRGEAHPLHALVRGRSIEAFMATRHEYLVDAQVWQLAGERSLELAKRNLAERFAAFGTDERFDESLLLFRHALGLRRIFYRRDNVTERRPRLAELPRSAIAAIERENALDLELFDFARRLLDERIAARGEAFADEVATFRRRNRWYARATGAVLAARPLVPRAVRAVIRRTGLF